MMNYKLKNQPERIQQELKALADRIPEILSVGLITPDGLKLGFYSKDLSYCRKKRHNFRATDSTG
jgi:hypothetical protein